MVISLLIRPGSHAIDGTAIAVLWPPDRVGHEASGAVNDCVTVGQARSPDQDVEFEVLVLEEMAVRALSPGTNDPYTAVNALDDLAAGLARSRADPRHPRTATATTASCAWWHPAWCSPTCWTGCSTPCASTPSPTPRCSDGRSNSPSRSVPPACSPQSWPDSAPTSGASSRRSNVARPRPAISSSYVVKPTTRHTVCPRSTKPGGDPRTLHTPLPRGDDRSSRNRL